MNDLFKNMRWQRVQTVTGGSDAAPPLPGIYAYAEVEKISGLPSKVTWVYIGKAQNLSVRLSNHESLNAINSDLSRWLFKVKDKGELWYAVVEQHLSNRIEIALIQEFQPKFNKVLYKGRDNVEFTMEYA